MTWCKRISKDFDISSTATANIVLQEALDCFTSCLSSPQKRLPVAEAIGAKLNVTKVKVGATEKILANNYVSRSNEGRHIVLV